MVYPEVRWFKNKGTRDYVKAIEEGRTHRADKLRALGKGVRRRPMLVPTVDYLPAKSKKHK